jgi:hypothetical protein
LMLMLIGGGLAYCIVYSRRLARRLGVACVRCGIPVFREADLRAGKCGACGAIPWVE